MNNHQQDCNANGIPDTDDISSGTSNDCDGNGVPDECQPDCNGNGIADSCDIADGFALDCNQNGIPDDCDIAGDLSLDANLNGVPDSCEGPGAYWILSPVTGNWYAVTDELEAENASQTATNWGGYLAAVGSLEENVWLATTFGDSTHPVWIGLTDAFQEGSFEWLNGEPFVLDPGDVWRAGEPDNLPGTFGADFVVCLHDDARWMDEPNEADSWPTLPRGVVELESPDCDGNGLPDVSEFLQDPSLDCNGNGILDSCDVLDGTSTDCDGNGLPDECDVANDPSLDCDGDGLHDACELDCDGDGVIDDCDPVGIQICASVPNSSGQAAVLSAVGGTCLGQSSLELTVDGLPWLLGGQLWVSTDGPRPRHPYQLGTVCVGRPVVLAIVLEGNEGSFSYTLDLSNLPPGFQPLPGDTHVFQMLFRDKLNNVGPYVSGALEVTFQ